MKILYFVHLFYPNIGGIETLSMHALPLLREKGHEIVVVTSTSKEAQKPRDNYEGIPVYRLPMLDALREQNIRQFLFIRQSLTKILKEFSPDLIHIHFGGAPVSIFLLSLAGCQLPPYLVTLHAGIDDLETGPDTFLGRLLGQSTWVTAVSDAVMQSALKVMPSLTGKISRIYNGVPNPKIAPADLDFSTPNILCFGRMVEEKGFDVMLDAFQLLHRTYPQARLTFAGDGATRKELERLTATYGLEKSVSFLGWVHPAEIANLINQSTIVVVPSRWEEPFGLVAVEAALMKRPVVAAWVGGLKEILQDRVTGLFFENENVEELARAVSSLLSDPGMAIEVGQRAQQYVQTQFSIEQYVEQYHGLYNLLAKGRTV